MRLLGFAGLALLLGALQPQAHARSTSGDTPARASGTVRPASATVRATADAKAAKPQPATRRFKERMKRPVPAVVGGAEKGPRAAAEARFAARAYPAEDVPSNAHDLARSTFAALAAGGRGPGAWTLVGPDRARYPGMNSYSGADYVTSGRITALAIAPTCTPAACRLWVGAAGGGIWRTERAMDATPQWRFVSGSFDTNAIGHLAVDPNDPSGNTLYAGTGEPNASGDSAAGVGIYKTTDGGDTWTLLPGSKAAMNGRAVSSIAISPAGTLWVGTARAIRGVTSVSGGGVTLNPAFAPWGLWRSDDGGNTFALAWDSSTSARGVTDVELDPLDPDTVYAAAFGVGIWRSSARLDGDSTFRRVLWHSLNNGASSRAQLALTVKDGKTRVYAAEGAGAGAPYARVWRVDDAGVPALALAGPAPGAGANPGWKSLTSSNVASPFYATYAFCTEQCWYDIDVVTPRGYPDMVYVLGSYAYGEYWRLSNARAVLLSTTAGDPDPANGDRTFTDVTWAGTPPWRPDAIHPDQHELVVHPDDPNIFFEGSDGGLMRSDGAWVSMSDQCAARGQTGARLTTCQRLLSRVPRRLVNMNAGLTTLQFQSLSVSNQRPLHLVLGGTQDNGTFDYNGSAAFWSQSIGGDGGQSGFDAVDDKIRFHTYYGPYVDVSFNQALPKTWVWVSDPFVMYPENWNFYVPAISDPTVGGTLFVGQQHVWRTLDHGGDRAFLETYCSETEAAPGPAPAPCGNWVPMGGAWGTPAGDLTSNAYGTTKQTGFHYIAALARSTGNAGTLWVATNTGRLFVTHNANAADANAVAFTRVDTAASPARFVSGLAVDPANPYRAWVSYTGYNFNTPSTPGHVFEVNVDPATGVGTFTNLLVEGATGDLPINGIARDDVTGDLYVATDFGVLRRSAASASWGEAAAGLPRVEVAGLTLHSGGRVLYAATHGRSAWRLMLP